MSNYKYDAAGKFVVQQENKRVLWIAQYHQEARSEYTHMKKALAPITSRSSDAELRIELINGNKLILMSTQANDLCYPMNIDLLVIDASLPLPYKEELFRYYPFTHKMIEKSR